MEKKNGTNNETSNGTKKETSNANQPVFLSVSQLDKSYGSGAARVKVLDGVTTSLAAGQICVILGPSGSGKSTFLNAVGGLERIDGGRIIIDGQDISRLDPASLGRYRRDKLGFVFQFYNLIPNLTALENVEMATELAKAPFSAKQVLEDVGLGERMHNFPAQLSGGEQQRVAIARALAKNPKLLLCDEPTGALDDTTGKQVLKILQDLSREKGMTVVIITHNSALTEMADRVVKVKSGTVSSVRINEAAKPIEEIEW